MATCAPVPLISAGGTQVADMSQSLQFDTHTHTHTQTCARQCRLWSADKVGKFQTQKREKGWSAITYNSFFL